MGCRPRGKAATHNLTLRKKDSPMDFGNLLHWAVTFLVVALIAALLGFGGVAGTAMEGAKLLFWVAIIFAVVAFVFNMLRRG